VNGNHEDGFLFNNRQIIHTLLACFRLHYMYVVAIQHYSNGFDDLLSNEVTTPELTIEDSGRLLDIMMLNKASTDARLDVYMSNSLGHHLPGRIFSCMLPPTLKGERERVSSYGAGIEQVKYL